MGGKKVFELILEIGHKSSPLNKKLANGYTHKWTAFVKGVNNSKIEHCIQRVVFQLHESFENPYREISQPPFQIKETGYAGFEIPIQIYFKNKEKPNHLVFVHDLCLLTNKANNAIKQERIKFINPDKEFEKCLIKSGAQLLSVAVKKERSDSPPAKKQKSSSLIPSKDMSKQPHPQTQTANQAQQQHHNHHHQKSSSHQNNNHNSSSNHHHSSSGSTKHHSSSHNNTTHNDHRNNHHDHHQSGNHNQSHQQQNHHPPSSNQHPKSLGQQASHTNNHHQPQQQTQTGQQKPKGSSRDFIDLFGAPLVYNPNNSKHPHKHHNNHKHSKYDNSKYDIVVKEEPPARTPPPPPPSSVQQHNHHHHHHQQPPPPPPPIAAAVATPVPLATPTPIPAPIATAPIVATVPAPTKEDQYANDLQMIQTKISCLSDCDRLQKIVDIVEEAGEWFNLTSKKFEFDLKRLDRKTLSKIERCLQLH